MTGFTITYVTPAKRVSTQRRASFTGAHNLAQQLRRKRCSSIGVEDAATGNEVYYLS